MPKAKLMIISRGALLKIFLPRCTEVKSENAFIKIHTHTKRLDSKLNISMEKGCSPYEIHTLKKWNIHT